MRHREIRVGGADTALDVHLGAELQRHNNAATPDVAPAEELTVRVEADGLLLAGASGWTWGGAAGIAMTWVHDEHRGQGLGAQLIGAFETEARARGCTHVFVTSFTFHAPSSYEGLGYREIFRWDGVPTTGLADVHLRKDL